MRHAPSWYYALNSAENGFTLREGTLDDWHVIGTVPMTNDATVAKDRAEKIVRAVNCHDDLLAALKQLLNEAEAAGFGGAKDFNWPKSVSDSRAAIKKAEGRS